MHPLFLLSIALQIACAVHVVRTGRPMYWIFILLIGSLIAVAIYLLAEVLPEMRNNPAMRKRVRAARDSLDPGREHRDAQRRLRISDTVGNRKALAEQCLHNGDAIEAERLYREALTGLYRTDPDLMLGLAQAQFAQDKPRQTRETLDALIHENPDYRSHDGHLLYARAVEACDDLDAALHEYEAVVVGYPGEEARARHGLLLQRMGRTDAAMDVFRSMLDRAQDQPRYYGQKERQWLDIARQQLSK